MRGKRVTGPPVAARHDPDAPGPDLPHERSRSRARPARSTWPLPDDLVEVAARRIVARLAARLRRNGARLRAVEPDAEAVHDFRVTTRRLRAALRLFGDVLPEKPLRAVRKRLRDLGRVAGKARDLEVLVADIRDFRETRPDAAPLDEVIERWEQRRARAFASLLRFHARTAVASLPARLTRLSKAPLSRSGRRTVRHVAGAILLTVLADAREAAARAEPEPEGAVNFDELHDLRIAVKRLRYAIEFLRATVPAVHALVPRLVAIQDRLGKIQDGRTLRDRLAKDRGRRRKASAGADPGAVVEDYLVARDTAPEAAAAAVTAAREVLEGPDLKLALADAVAKL